MDDSAALPASSSQLQAIVSRMALALSYVEESIVWTDAHGCIQWCNAAFERLVNQTAETMAEQLLAQVLPLTLEGEVLPLFLHPVNWALATRQPREEQYGFHRHDRSFRLAITVAPLPCTEDDRTAEGVMLIMRELAAQCGEPRSLPPIDLELEGTIRARAAELNHDRQRAEIERQQTEAALTESEQRFCDVFEKTAVATAMTSLEGAYLQVNAAYCQTVGYTEAELLTLSFQQLTHPDDIAAGALHRHKLAAGEVFSHNIEKRCIHKDGHIVWCLLSLLIVRDLQQQPLYYVAQMQNITDRKQAEAALSESEARLKLALESAQMSTWDWNLLTDEAIYSGHLNPGLSLPSAVQSAAYESFLQAVDPDDRDYVVDTLARALKGADYNAEFRVRWADGTQHWVCSKGKTYFDQQGVPVRMLGVLRDITTRKQAELSLQQLNQELEQRMQRRTAQLEQINKQLEAAIAAHEQTEAALRKSEERFRIIFDGAPIAIGLADIQTYQFVEVNQAHHELLGYNNAELASLTHVDITHPDDNDKNLDHIQQLLDGTIARVQLEKRFVKKNGDWIWATLTVTLIRDPDGRTYSMGMIEDITDRKRAEDQLKASLTEKEFLLKEVHHRVKNNLQTVCSLLNLQAHTIQDPSALEPFQDSQRRIKAMALVHERLYQSESLAKVNFSDYVHHLITDLIHSYSTDAIKIHWQVEIAQLELPVGAVVPCGLIINELVNNALKYAFPDDRTGEIQICFSVSTTNHCLLVVADDGAGFLTSMAALQQATPDSLGLQLVYAFVHQLRGTIELDCSRGTRFELSFPNPA